MTRYLPYEVPTPQSRRAREVAAALLRALGASLDRLAVKLAVAEQPVPTVEPLYEFHAEAGAPEGALYVNGQRVGTLVGVKRL